MASSTSNPLPMRPPSTLPTSSLYQAPQLRYFISRDNGTVVPLVPADELPYNIRLEGVQRVMTMENASGMTLVGTLPFTGRFFKIDSSSCPRPAVETAKTPTAPPSATAMTWRRKDDSPNDTTQAKIDNIVASGIRPATPTAQKTPKESKTPSSSSRSTPEPGEKVYCTHWIRHGECDYTQQGCRYKHEMPDKATLSGIGFRTVPRWWQEKVAVQLGQSAIPTVGPVMKAEEWLKRRRSSLGSASSHSSDSDSELEEDEKNATTGEADTPLPSMLKRDQEEEDLSSREDTAKVREIVKASESDTASTGISTASNVRPEVKVRQLSLSGDLIDFSPTLPILSCPRPTSTFSKADMATSSTSSTKADIQSPSKPEIKQSPASPRKIFVPAGESREHHIAEARKHAKTLARNDGERVREDMTLKSPADVDEHSSVSRHLVNPGNIQILKRPEYAGLMASKHASTGTPQPAVGVLNHVIKPNTNALTRQEPINSKKHQIPAKTSNKKPSPPKKAMKSKPKPTTSPSPANSKLKATDSVKFDNLKKKAETSSGPPDACRPRRPKANVSKIQVPKDLANWYREQSQAQK